MVALKAVGVTQGHPGWVDGVGEGPTQPAVVGCEGRVVQPPVLEVIISRILIPAQSEIEIERQIQQREMKEIVL